MKRAEKYTPNNLRKYRHINGYEQKEVAFLLGLRSAGRISEWENGISKPSMDNLMQLSIIYRTLPDELYYDLRQEFLKDFAKRQKLLLEKRVQDLGG